MEFYPVDTGTIDRRSKTGGLKAVRDAATSPVMAGFYNTSPADLGILTELACQLLGKGALNFMGSLNGGLGGDCFLVSPVWVGLMVDIPDGSIDRLAGLWVAGLAEEYGSAPLDVAELTGDFTIWSGCAEKHGRTGWTWCSSGRRNRVDGWVARRCLSHALTQQPPPRPFDQQKVGSRAAKVIFSFHLDDLVIVFIFVVRARVNGSVCHAVAKYSANCQVSKIVLISATKAGISARKSAWVSAAWMKFKNFSPTR
jgi:hypothetical protein